MTDTLRYYEEHAKAFVEGTLSADMSLLRGRFLSRVKKGGHILDLGCGSGRDSRAFLDEGYRVTAVDGSPALASFASALLDQEVVVSRFEEYVPTETFDGIWASASLLHLKECDIVSVMRRLTLHLAPGGIFYCSFKYGKGEKVRDGRFFSDYDEETFLSLMSSLPGLGILDIFVSSDVRPGRDEERWLNVLLSKA